jgi:hypothetical protein
MLISLLLCFSFDRCLITIELHALASTSCPRKRLVILITTPWACIDAYIDRMQEIRQQKISRRKWNCLVGFQNIIANLGRRTEQKNVLDERSNYSDAIIGKHGGTNDLQCMKTIRLVRSAAFEINFLQYVTLILEKRNGSTCGYNGRTGICEQDRL